MTAISRWDVDDINNTNKKLTSYTSYYNTGTPISTTDAGGHQNNITYGDSFSDNVNRNTFAYPTTITNADNFSSYVQYNFDFGATTRTQSPAPANQSQGAIQTMNYNSLGQLERITSTNNGAYRRFWYGATYTASYATVNSIADEAFAAQATDGMGRVIGAFTNHPGSSGGYSVVSTIYDQMGRAWKVSNPIEVTDSWQPSGDDAAGYYYTQQTYDWKGRPLVTTNTDGTTKEASYTGCGCAGGEVVTLTDEGTIDAGVAKRRQQKIYSDVLGRTRKTELLNWQGGSVYSATVNTYNALDQIIQVRQYAGAEGSGTYQDTTLTYDGYGRLKTKHVPEQSAGANTVWDYNADDTIQKITDGRGVTAFYTYNQRHLVTGIIYTVPPGSQIPVPSQISYAYDAASNRTSMTDGTGTTTYNYDSLSRMSSESRTFTGVGGTYALSYSYNLDNALTALSIPFRSKEIGYHYDNAGRLSYVTGNGFTATYVVWPNVYTQSVTTLASDIAYRAWGGRKSMTYGNTTSEQTTYNSRLQPVTYTLNNMNYRNANICCPNPTYSTMTWTFDYYNDGRVKTAWDSTNDWFDRAYKYDHAGRLKEASTYRRARGLSPLAQSPDPYFQNITYDAFNHMSRSGLLYTGEPSDVGTWINNRRTGLGWQYDADGNTTTDPNFTQTFDAAGKPSHSVSFAKVGDGANYPYQPSTDIAQTYDGTGAPAKRIQISRQQDSGDEPPLEDIQTTSYVRSTVLGAAVVELNGPIASDIVNVYAGGQRIARDESDNIIFEHTNPVVGNRVTSAGYSTYRWTTRQERDSFGAEIPTSNPYPTASSYGDYKFGEQFYILGGDPFDYSTGREIDGIPVSEAEFQRRTGNGSVDAQKTDRKGNVYTSKDLVIYPTSIWIDDWILHHSVSGTDFPLVVGSDGSVTFPTGPIVTTIAHNAGYFVTPAEGLQLSNHAVLRSLQSPERRLTKAEYLPIRSEMAKALNSEKCRNFIDRLVGYNYGAPYDSSEDFLALSDYIYNSSDGGVFWGSATQVGNKVRIGSNVRPDLNLMSLAATLMHELIHRLQRPRGGDEQLARNIRDLGIVPLDREGNPLPFPTGGRDGKPIDWSKYWDTALHNACFPKLP